MRPRRDSEDGPSRKESRLRRASKVSRSDPNRFSGNGIQFKAKIIGTERVLDARGNRMCQGALQRLKAAVKTSGDHKQRIILNVSLNGIIIKDEKTGEVLHHHPIHKISFISQDTGDNRAFGYVFGCPQTGHDFFGIKTEKMASQVVLTLRDLFLAALELKKKEMEEEVGMPAAEVPSECGASNEQTAADNDFKRTEKSEELPHPETPPDEPNAAATENACFKFSVDSLKQGISHMDRSIARGFGFSFSEDDVSESSVNSIPASFQFKMDKLASLYHETMSLSSRSSSTSEYACVSECQEEEDRRASSETTTSPRREDRYAVFLEDIDALPSVFDNPSITLQPLVVPRPKTPDQEEEAPKEVVEPPASAPVAFAELDPLGSQPYVDRKDFFHELKKPPKKALKDLTEGFSSSTDPENGFFPAFTAPPAFNPFAEPPALPPKKPPAFPEDSSGWGRQSPFNPFLSEDIPPPSSPPPPPPPPRLPLDPCSPAPPPRPPGRPPAWLSFNDGEQPSYEGEGFSYSKDEGLSSKSKGPTHKGDGLSFQGEGLSFDSEMPPPLPSPARRRFSQADSPPCTPPAWGNAVAPAHVEMGAEVFCFPEEVGARDSPHFQRRVSKPQENGGVFRNGGESGLRNGASPPLPPKPVRSEGFSASTNGTHAFSTEEEGRRGEGQELSPDSIFRKKDDPFADDFFLSLPKKEKPSA